VLNPHLPAAAPHLGPSHSRQYRERFGRPFHQACLEFSQALWQQGKPAQAILQLNKAAMVPDLAAPYSALVWYLAQRPPEQFIGNPVRHFQHLASRMSGPHRTLRTWRAWACFHLAETILPKLDFPRDFLQLEKEALQIPPLPLVEKKLPSCDSSGLSEAKALARTLPKTRS